MTTTVYIALGSNAGSHGRHTPAAQIRAAIASLQALPGVSMVQTSRIYRSAPMGPRQRDFANAVARLVFGIQPDYPQLLGALKQMEKRFGRRATRRWGPRPLDLDIIGDDAGTVLPGRCQWPNGRTLVLPHPGMHRRTFVLRPMGELAPFWRHPIMARTVRQLLARLPRRQLGPIA